MDALKKPKPNNENRIFDSAIHLLEANYEDCNTQKHHIISM